MTAIEKAIERFFDTKGDIYYNPNDVEVTWLLDDGVCVVALWPDVDRDGEITLEVVWDCDSYADFIKTFNINRNVHEVIDSITHDNLMDLYFRGKAEIYCATDCNLEKSLYFRKQNNIMTARTEGDEDDAFEVYGLEETAEDIINYTIRFYF